MVQKIPQHVYLSHNQTKTLEIVTTIETAR